MSQRKSSLSILRDTFAICKLEKDAQIPDWALAGRFISVTRTPEELSIVCPQSNVPEGTKADVGWRCLEVEGPLSLSESGIIASFAGPLAHAGISIFVVSTFDTDYVLVKENDLEKTVFVLSRQGHHVRR